VDPRELDGGREMPNLHHNDLPTQHAQRPPAGSLAMRLAKARAEQERRALVVPDEQPDAADDSAARERAGHPPSTPAITPLRRTRRHVDAQALEPELTALAPGVGTRRIGTVTPESVGRLSRTPETQGAGAPDGGALDNAVASADIAELREQARRARDEMAAVRRRGEHEKEEYTRFAKGETVKSFIPVLDDLERALAHVPARLRDDPWVAGVAMVGESVSAMLRREGIERIEPHGELFDPRMHEAIARVEDGVAGVDDEDGAESATVEQRVTQVYQPGYVLNGRVLRPALVQVTISRQQVAISGQQSAAGCQDDGDNFEIDRCHRLVADHPSLIADC